MLCQTIEEVVRICAEQNRPVPEHLILQVDNTVSQAKNETTALFLAMLVAQRKFKTVNLFFLIVGHTHEDVDQLFALCMHTLVQKGEFQTPEEMLAFLEEGLDSRMKARGSQLICSHLYAVRDFDSWLAALGRKVWNCFGNRNGLEAPHAFTYKLRQDLTAKDFHHGVVAPGHPNDVFCCLKTYMHLSRIIPQGHN